MNLNADYHTHTVFSHGKGDVIDNARAAAEKGLKELGIADHGFAHPAFGLRKRKLPELKKRIENAKKETGVNVLLGIESNIIGTDGTTDLKPELYDDFDIFLAGVHKFVKYKFGTAFSLFLPNLFNSAVRKRDVPKSLIRRNTQTYINVIKNNPVDVITHLNFCCFADAAEVAKAAADYGTYIELNSKKVHLSDDELYEVLKTDVKFVINSDAHSPSRVGEISLVEKMLERTGFPTERIANIDGRLPEFRFAEFKGRAGR
ncbi:MAG: PHP domain-containing protein [Candidatus Borkfalkiaceae bacterium]|nr:PHP domain-containing protein [Christensenellaceae bacterium]